MAERIKTSVGVWAFGALPTRFVPSGYHPELAGKDVTELLPPVVESLGDRVDGYEFHYPGEINAGNLERIRRILGSHDIYCIAAGFHGDSRNARGAFTNPSAAMRRTNVERAIEAIDLAAEVGANYIIWPGLDGYNYPFQVDYRREWDYFLDGVGQAVGYAARRGVKVFLEHKNSEPAMNIYMRNIGMTLFTVNRLKELGVDTSLVRVNMDWQHLIMNGENLAEYASLLLSLGLMGHHHANSGWGSFDDDNMTGTTYFMQTLELALVLLDGGYGRGGERVGFDLFPYTEDAVSAVRASVEQWEFILSLAERIDRETLAAARASKDAVGAYRAVYRALGLDDAFLRGRFQTGCG